MADKMIIVFEGEAIFHDPDLAGEVARAVVAECVRIFGQGRKDVRVVSTTFSRAGVALRLTPLRGSDEVGPELEREARVIFRAAVEAAVRRHKGVANG
jgi:hypothetical protein